MGRWRVWEGECGVGAGYVDGRERGGDNSIGLPVPSCRRRRNQHVGRAILIERMLGEHTGLREEGGKDRKV